MSKGNGTIYALLVGVDKYAGGVTNLNGCENDVQEFSDLLKERYGAEEKNTKLLLSKDATRENIIKGFTDHLSQAKTGDTALFYYSGHGAQEIAPEAFWGMEPDRLNETLVCHDSRTFGGWDLADKELRYLIHGLTKKDKPHITIILDSCHSSSGTRDPIDNLEGVRLTEIHPDERPIEKYCFYEDFKARGIDSASFDFPQGQHILLSACRDSELAKEIFIDGKTRGTFSHYLRTTLSGQHESMSYRDLLARVRRRVEASVSAQTPQLEPIAEANPDEKFLGGNILSHQGYLIYREDGQWWLDAGAVHGITPPEGEHTTHLAIFLPNTKPDDLTNLTKKTATATIKEVLSSKSKLAIESELSTVAEDGGDQAQYKAVITKLPLPTLAVRFEGDELGQDKAREQLANINGSGKASVFVREDKDNPLFRLIAKEKKYFVMRVADDRPLLKAIEGGYTDGTARKAIRNLEHIARWHQKADLNNPGTKIPKDAVQMVVTYEDKEYTDSDDLPPFVYKKAKNGEWQQPKFKLELRLAEDYNKPLYCALVYLNGNGSFQISASALLQTYGSWLDPIGKEKEKAGAVVKVIPAYEGKPIPVSVTGSLWEQGVTEAKDILKLIVSTEEFDSSILDQEKLELWDPETKGAKRSLTGTLGTLNQYLDYASSRDIGDDAEPEQHNDWMSKSITLTTIRPQESVELSKKEARSIFEQVIVEPHAHLKARVSLESSNQLTRSLEQEGLEGASRMQTPAILTQDPEVSQPFVFTASRGSDAGLNVIKLDIDSSDEKSNHTTVNSENPLIITVNQPLAEHEQILPYTFDEETKEYWPLGYAKRLDYGKTQIYIERLPAPKSDTKDLIGSVWLMFQKLTYETLNIEKGTAFLAIPEFKTNANKLDELKKYNRNTKDIEQKVAQAQNIVVFIHGIIGDTRSMAGSLTRIKTFDQNTSGNHKIDKYDLILTFDYENLNTAIDENAQLLKDKLAEVGLDKNKSADKSLTLVAHSMGGLISRWFIEKLEGKDVVEKLIMLGTPNGGSPWSDVENNVSAVVKGWANTTLAVFLNNLTRSPVKTIAVAGLMKLLDASDNSLDQMNKESELLAKLEQSPDPKTPYHIIVGDTAKITYTTSGNTLQRLVQNLANRFQDWVFDLLTKKLFLKPNDIAVSVASIKNVPLQRTPSPEVIDVACHHLSYFTNREGLEALERALTKEG